MSDKVDLLRRVEIKFNQLVEWRKQYTERGPEQLKDVIAMEKIRRGDRQKENQEKKLADAKLKDEEKRLIQERKRIEKEFLL